MKNLFIILLFSMQMFALPGDLDTSFGVSGGYVVSDFFSQQFDEEPNDVAVQSDGKIVLGGTRSTSTLNNNYDFLVVRYNSDMSLDTTFSGDGIFTLSDASFDVVNAIAIQADGKIVAVGEGTSTNEAYVFRLNANGTLDTTFSGDGIVKVSSSGFALSVAIQTADSKIVIGTKQSLGQTAILRLTTTGILDTTFDGDGRVFLSPNHYFPLDIAIQTDGKIVAVGTNSISNSGVMSTVRLLSNGSIDTTFDGDGYANTAPFSGEYYAKGVLIQADGKIVVGGGVGDFGVVSVDAVIIRYNSDGTLDMTFSGDGILTFRFIEGGSSYVNDIAQQPDGKIVASVDTTYTLAGTEDFSMIRLNTDGAFDASFDGNGIVQSQWCEDGQDLAFQSDGKIVAVGWQTRPNVTERGVCTQRFNSDGTVDYSVNPTAPNGRVVQKFTSVNAIEGLPNGKILVAGYESLLDVNGNFLRDAARLIRLNSDGTLDSTFMDEGAYEYVNSSGSSYFNDLKILGDGSFLVAGETGNAGGIITKFTPAGILDTTFSGDGVYTGNIITRIYGLAVQTDGKVIGCGSNGSGLAPRSGKIVRLSATGTFEQDTFSSFGNANSNEVFECGLQSDGKLIVSGFGNNGTSDFIGTSRKLSTLAPDTTFGTNGIVTTDMSATLNDRATDMVIQPDDKIVVSSQGFNINGDRDYAVIRYNSNGTLDNSFVDLFGTNGISLINFGATNPNDEANAILLQPDGQLIAGGVSDTGTVKLFSLAKLNGDGSPALGFGILGRTGTQFPNNDSQVNALGFQFDGKILAGGRTWNGTAYDFAIARFQNEAPTAASVSVGGRVLTAQGSGIRNAVITLTGGSLTQPITTRTSSFGYYRFDEIPAGATYILTVGSKRFSFTNPSMIISLSDEINEANFVAEQ